MLARSRVQFCNSLSLSISSWLKVCEICEVGGGAELDSSVSLMHIEDQQRPFSLWQERESNGTLEITDLSMLGLSHHIPCASSDKLLSNHHFRSSLS